MTTNKLTETLDTLSDKAFGLKDNSPESDSASHENGPETHREDQTETFETSHAPTAKYPAAHVDPESHEPTAPATTQNHVPAPPVNPPSQHEHSGGHNRAGLKTGPEQDFTVATVAGFVGALCLLLMFSAPVVGLLAIIFGATAVLYARKTERAGIGAGLGKTLGWFSFFGGVVALLAASFFLFIAFIVAMVS